MKTETTIQTRCTLNLTPVRVPAGTKFQALIKRNTHRGDYDGYAVILVPGYGKATIAPHNFDVLPK